METTFNNNVTGLTDFTRNETMNRIEASFYSEIISVNPVVRESAKSSYQFCTIHNPLVNRLTEAIIPASMTQGIKAGQKYLCKMIKNPSGELSFSASNLPQREKMLVSEAEELMKQYFAQQAAKASNKPSLADEVEF